MKVSKSNSISLLTAVMAVLFFSATAMSQWQKQTLETTTSFRGLSVVSENIIWASGTGGTVVRTIDGGKTWKIIKVPAAEKLDFRDIEAFDESIAYIVSIGEGESSRIYKTIDGGESWKLQFQNTEPKAFFDALAFWDKNNGVAMSDPVNGYFYLFGTRNGGETWNKLDTEKMIPAKDGEAAFAASGTCIITQGKKNVFLVSGGKQARVFRSNNGGYAWYVTESPIIKGEASQGIFGISMYDALNGVIVGGDYAKPNDAVSNLAFTKDGGKTWEETKGFSGFRSAASYVDKKTLIAVGSAGSDISNDGGKTWKALDKESYNALQIKGRNAIWAAGEKGRISRFASSK
jgi:photosystem II stability/assembly factor-like uncharacterized protein